MPGGRPAGSLGKKKREELAAQQRLTSLTSSLATNLRSKKTPTVQEYEDSEEDDVTTESFVDSLDKAIAVINSELQKIRRDFSKAIEEHDKAIEALRTENTSLKTRCESLEARIASLENSQVSQAELINKQERFSRRNNFRIVGLKTESDEDSIQKAMEVIAKVGVNNCKIERAHRDGRSVPGRDRHLLVKLSYYQDKVTIMKNARQALASENYYIIDDLTKLDLKEKRRWSQQVNQLFEQGTRLRFSGGCWRSINGKPYVFPTQ